MKFTLRKGIAWLLTMAMLLVTLCSCNISERFGEELFADGNKEVQDGDEDDDEDENEDKDEVQDEDEENDGAENLTESRGLEFVSNGDGTCYVKGIGTCTDTDIVIPKISPDGDTVTGIGSCAFYGCHTLTNITIPDSVTSIEYCAFSNCCALTNITIPDSVTSMGSGVFEGSGYYLDESNWIDGVLYIGNHLVDAKHSVSSCVVKHGTKTIASYVFAHCEALRSITIPNSVIGIGGQVFSHCISLESITVERGNSVYHSDGNCLIETASKTLIAGCKTSIIPNDGSVTAIGRFAFEGCYGLTNLIIPSSVTYLGYAAFGECYNLTSITFEENSQLQCITDDSFSNCNGLTSITIPSSVIFVGQDAFVGCNKLSNVVFENPNGWRVESSSAMIGIGLSATSLANPATAATYLKDTYDGYTWERS